MIREIFPIFQKFEIFGFLLKFFLTKFQDFLLGEFAIFSEPKHFIFLELNLFIFFIFIFIICHICKN